MMGRTILDPDHTEGELEAMPGLGLLPTVTTMLPEKVTRQVRFAFADGSSTMQGYEIHMGETVAADGGTIRPLNRLENGQEDGCFADDKCMGTYIHGILDNPAFVERLLAPHAGKVSANAAPFDYQEFKEQQYDLLADHIRRYVDVDLLYKIIGR